MDVASLSEEAFDALFTVERLEMDPSALDELLPGMRALAAAGLAELAQDEFRLLETGAFIRNGVVAPLVRALWLMPEDSGNGSFLWTLVTQSTLLEHRWDNVGVHTFRLRNLRSALNETLSSVVPAAEPGASGSGSDLPVDPSDEELEAFVDDLVATCSMASVQVIAPGESGAAGEMPSATMLMASGAGRGTILVAASENGAVEIVNVDRAAIRKRLLGYLGTSG